MLTLSVNVCCGQSDRKAEGPDAAPLAFEMVSIPARITDPGERAEYLVRHYWDKFDFKDTAYIHVPQVTEQALSNYIDLARYVSPSVMSASLRAVMERAEQDATMFRYFSEMMEKYLYDPESPLRNEEMYITVLEYLVGSASLSDAEKIRPAHLLDLALRNRVGTPAADFAYTLADGQTGRLYDLKADYLLLFFYDPDCHTCREVSRQMESSPVIGDLLKSGRLRILAVYPGEDLDAWRAYIPALPKDWIDSYDKGMSIRNDEIYDLKAMPTLYLLDGEKRVLLKEAAFRQVEIYLSGITN